MKKIVYDCESQNLFRDVPGSDAKPWLLKLSTSVTYCYEDDEYKFWTMNTQKELLEYMNGNTIIGFNSYRFDNPLLLGEHYQISLTDNSCTNGTYQWKNVDIYTNIIKLITNMKKESDHAVVEKSLTFRPPSGVYKLDNICKATLNCSGKSGDGAEAVDLFKAKKILELVQYNLQDVRLTKQLYDFIVSKGYLINGNYDILKFR